MFQTICLVEIITHKLPCFCRLHFHQLINSYYGKILLVLLKRTLVFIASARGAVIQSFKLTKSEIKIWYREKSRSVIFISVAAKLSNRVFNNQPETFVVKKIRIQVLTNTTATSLSLLLRTPVKIYLIVYMQYHLRPCIPNLNSNVRVRTSFSQFLKFDFNVIFL